MFDMWRSVIKTFFYLLHQHNCRLPKKNVKAGDEAKLARERRLKRHNLRFWRSVKGCLKVEVVFVVAGHQETIGTGGTKRRWTVNWGQVI